MQKVFANLFLSLRWSMSKRDHFCATLMSQTKSHRRNHLKERKIQFTQAMLLTIEFIFFDRARAKLEMISIKTRAFAFT